MNKSWHDQKSEVYHRLYKGNLSALAEKKVFFFSIKNSRADEIIRKHQEITDRNHIYRERKDHLFKAIKYHPDHL